MSDRPNKDPSLHDIASQVSRKRAQRDQPAPSPLRGFGTFGMIGWSIVVPTVGGAFLGLWLDRVAPRDFSWTIALILGGVVAGALLAWSWVDRENRR
ncbi:MAG: ATPase F0F1 [Granulosicoccus sp.]|nr:ATPase F0F1 [Granulosicoccus sp.]